jgi:hypothetical protein
MYIILTPYYFILSHALIVTSRLVHEITVILIFAAEYQRANGHQSGANEGTGGTSETDTNFAGKIKTYFPRYIRVTY